MYNEKFKKHIFFFQMAYYCRALADSSDFTLDRYLYRAYTNLSLQLGLCLFVKKDKGGGG